MTTLSFSSMRPSDRSRRGRRNPGRRLRSERRRLGAARADERLEMPEREGVVVGVERELVPFVREPGGEVEPGLAFILGTRVRIAAEVVVIVPALEVLVRADH